MTRAEHTRIEPAPTPEEAAAIAAALGALREEEPVKDEALNRSRWQLAGLFGHAVPPGMKLEGALWSYSSWEGMV
jgi:hypothetical protein